MKRPRHIARWVVLLALVALAYLTRGWTLPLAAAWLDVGEKPQPAEYVVVLGGDVNTRPFVAAALIRAGLARVVLVSHLGVLPDAPLRLLPPEEELARQILIQKGVPPEQVRPLGRNNRTTYDEARALAGFLRSAPPGRVLIPTSAFHTRRTRWVLRRILGTEADALVMVSIPPETFSMDSWWQSEEGFRTVIGENLKLAFYILRYGGAMVPVSIGLVAAAGVGLWLLWRRTKRRAPLPGSPATPGAPQPAVQGGAYLGLPPCGSLGSSGDASSEASSSPGNPR